MISIILATHRVDEYLSQSIESVLQQSIINFELLIIINGTHTLEIEKIIREKYSREPRIRIITSPIAQLSHALNLGISHANYDYIARMDADDICHPLRLQKQLDFLQKNELDMVGTDVYLIDENGLDIGKRILPKGKKIASCLGYKNPFIHPTILIKKSTLISARGYLGGFNSEDYDLWLRLKRAGIKWDNMDEPLLKYRIHSQASQGHILGYAECAGYAMREFILKKSFKNLLSLIIQFGKSVIR